MDKPYFHSSKLNVFIFVFLLFSLSAKSQAYLEEVDTLRPLRINQQLIDLQLSFAPQKGEVSGVLQLVFETTEETGDSIWLDGPFIEFTKVEYVGAQMKSHKTYTRGLAILLEEPATPFSLHKLNIEYTAQPRRGMYFVGWEPSNTIQPNQPTTQGQIWTQGQGVDNRYWLPMVDNQNDKVLWSVTATLPQELTFVSNGQRMRADTVDGQTTWRYTSGQPMAPYLIAIAVGDYVHQSHTSTSGIPLKNFLYPSDSDKFPLTYDRSTELFDWMEALLVPFPWSKYDQLPVREFQHGAMENTTTTLFGDFFVLGPRATYDSPYLEINAHELAHQWFGNLQTATNATHHWLQEGFATYLQWEAVREFLGEEAYYDRLEDARSTVYDAEGVDSYPLCHPKAGSARFYQKGGWLLTMLKEKVGEEDFYAGLKKYLALDPNTNRSTEDFIVVMEEVSGKKLRSFFSLWAFSADIPEVYFEVEKKGKRDFSFALVGTNIPEGVEIEIPIEIWNGASVEVLKVSLADGDSLIWDVDHHVTYAQVFPRKRTLCNVQENKPKIMWENQLKNAHVLDAEVALEALVSDDAIEAKKWAYYTVNGTAPARLQRVAAEVIAKDYPFVTTAPWFQYLHPTARTVFAENVDSIAPGDYAFFKPYLLDSTELGVIQWASLLGKINAEEVYEITSEVEPGSNGDLFFIRSLMVIDPQNPLLELEKWVDNTSPEMGYNLRMSSFGALAQINYWPDRAVANLVHACASGNRRLRNSARKILLNKIDPKRAQEQIFSYFEARPEAPDWKHIWFDKNFPSNEE